MTVSHVSYNKTIYKTENSPHFDGDSFVNFDPKDPHFKAL